jgi:hypothetical protein
LSFSQGLVYPELCPGASSHPRGLELLTEWCVECRWPLTECCVGIPVMVQCQEFREAGLVAGGLS